MIRKMVVVPKRHIEKGKERNNMDKKNIKFILNVLTAIAFVGLISIGVSLIFSLFVSNDYVQQIGDMKSMKALKLCIINLIAFIILGSLVAVVVYLAHNNKLNKRLSIVIPVVAVIVSIVSIILIWNYRGDMKATYMDGNLKWHEAEYFSYSKYVLWQSNFEVLLSVVVYSFVGMISTLMNYKLNIEEK